VRRVYEPAPRRVVARRQRSFSQNQADASPGKQGNPAPENQAKSQRRSRTLFKAEAKIRTPLTSGSKLVSRPLERLDTMLLGSIEHDVHREASIRRKVCFRKNDRKNVLRRLGPWRGATYASTARIGMVTMTVRPECDIVQSITMHIALAGRNECFEATLRVEISLRLDIDICPITKWYPSCIASCPPRLYTF